MQRVTQNPVSQNGISLVANNHSPMSLQEKYEAKRKSRNDAIDQFVSEAVERGDCTDRLYWTLIYDFEHASMTTNLRQLEEAGVRPLPAQMLNDEELFTSLWELISGLSDLGIFLLHSNHLTDRLLYERLVDHILVEPVRDLPPDSGVHEFIDLIGGGGPVEREIYQQHYASAEERSQFAKEYGFEISPKSPPSDRDRNFPKPQSERSQ
ncbi:MAG: hypothetical protein O2875_00180 [Planctomycetota bacterium]|nr:hypothetical protein [Planctomycetota bacterium]MDA1263338.1 hypothetical protein [Planctomycetota bacterium]